MEVKVPVALAPTAHEPHVTSGSLEHIYLSSLAPDTLWMAGPCSPSPISPLLRASGVVVAKVPVLWSLWRGHGHLSLALPVLHKALEAAQGREQSSSGGPGTVEAVGDSAPSVPTTQPGLSFCPASAPPCVNPWPGTEHLVHGRNMSPDCHCLH